MNKLLIVILLGSLAWGCKSTEVLRRDLQAQSMIEEGKKLLQKEQFKEAAAILESAAVRPANQSTSTALYLAGIAYYKAKKNYPAEQQFTRLIRSYPKSSYLHEAKYHRALLLLKKYDEDKKQEGVKTLYSLSIDRRRGDLAKDADQALRKFLFYDAKASFLQMLFANAGATQRQLFAEALAYRLVKTNQAVAAKAVYAELKSKNGQSEFLKKMLGDPADTKADKPNPDANRHKIAVFLPLFLSDYTFTGMDEIPRQSADALEFWEGFNHAIQEMGANSGKEVYVKVFDSRKNTGLILNQLKELEALAPDLIVGEVFTGPSKVIAEWAAKNKVPQLVPFSSNPDLISNESGYTFMARPIYNIHGSRMAKYAHSTLGIKHVGVWTDQRVITEDIANTFIKTFVELGGKVSRFPIDSVFEDRAQDDILDHFDDISKKDSIGGMYVPLGLEESAGLILSTLQVEFKEGDMVVMGTPSWESFKLIGQREKDRFKLTYTTPFSDEHNQPVYEVFQQSFNNQLLGQPTSTNTQGYGMGLYVAAILKDYDRTKMDLAERMRTFPAFKMPYSNMHFNETQTNQYLPIIQFSDGYPSQVD
ncbi:MAG: ABC transporter substrate-binding protein [Bacteroidia bacterium]